jgi:hypothetical protein
MVSQKIAFSLERGEEVPAGFGRAPDELSMPFLAKSVNHGQCLNDGGFFSTQFASYGLVTALDARLSELNRVILSYYQMQYAQEIAREALAINRELEAQYARILDI